MVKKGFIARLTPIQQVVVVAAIAGGVIFVAVDANGCALKEGVDMGTTNPNDFLYGDYLPLFCDLTDYLDAEAIGVIIDEYTFGGTENVDPFQLPPDATLNEVLVEDPSGVMFQVDEDDSIITDEQLKDLMETGNGPFIGNNATEILDESDNSGPEEPPPEEMNEISEFVFISSVKKIFSDLSEETVTNEVPFLPISLFVEDTSNKDFSTGRFETELFIRTDPFTDVTGIGEFDVLIDGMPNSATASASLEFQGTSDENGLLRVLFVSETGARSNNLVLSIEPLQPEIKLQGITTLDFVVTNLQGIIHDIDYGITNQTMFTFDIFRNPEQLLITDSEGNEVRAFPTDDQLRVGALDGSVRLSRCYKHSRTSCWMTSVYYSSLGSPTIASLELSNSAGDILFSKSTPTTSAWGIDNELVTRNDTYTVKYGRVTSSAGGIAAGSLQFTTPETQMNYLYRCTLSQASASIGGGFCRACLIPSGPISLSCNFPSP